MIDLDRKAEGLDYELIPSKELLEAEQAWDVRILKGDFTESIIRFGNIQVDGKNGQMHFNFTVIESPIEDLTPDSVDLQNEVGSILHSVLESAIAKDELQMNEVKT
jgi:hypothetical protein